MAWSEDDWRLARAAFDAASQAADDLDRAREGTSPEALDRLTRAAAGDGVSLANTMRQLRAFGAELPRTEPEARRALTVASRFKTQLVTMDRRLGADAAAGRIITQPDRAEFMAAGGSDALFRIHEIDWMAVERAQRVPVPGPPLPPSPPDPGRPPRRPATNWAPLLLIGGALLLMSKR